MLMLEKYVAVSGGFILAQSTLVPNEGQFSTLFGCPWAMPSTFKSYRDLNHYVAGDMFISTLTNQLSYYSRLALSIKLYIEYMVGLCVNILF